MNLRIRDIGRQDFDSILKINRESIPEVFELDTDEISLLIEICEYSKVIEFDSELAGYIFVLGKGLEYDGEEYNWFCKNISDDFLYIDQVSVGKVWAGKGCGKALYKDLENYAIQNQKIALVCEVNYKPLNQKSMRFHTSLGFVELSYMEARGTTVSLLAKRGLTNHA